MASRIAGLIALVVFACSVIVAGCVDVPEGIRANFAAPAPQERSNYRPGEHGVARPAESASPPATKAAAADVGTTTTTAGDGGAP